jgi:hypothetical protein
MEIGPDHPCIRELAIGIGEEGIDRVGEVEGEMLRGLRLWYSVGSGRCAGSWRDPVELKGADAVSSGPSSFL